MTNKDLPIVWIDSVALTKLQTYCKYADKGEISGLGVVEPDQGELLVSDILLFEQTASFSETELDIDTLAKWDLKLRESGGDPTLYRLWWHKHPIQGWSSVDDANIEKMDNGEWLLSIVQTPSGLLARLDLYKPFRITLDNLTIKENRGIDWELDKALKQEVADKVKARTYATINNNPPRSYLGASGTMSREARIFVPDGKGEWQLLNEKKDTSPKDTSSTENTDERDEYFRKLADQDWEGHFGWDESSVRNRLYRGGY